MFTSKPHQEYSFMHEFYEIDKFSTAKCTDFSHAFLNYFSWNQQWIEQTVKLQSASEVFENEKYPMLSLHLWHIIENAVNKIVLLQPKQKSEFDSKKCLYTSQSWKL